MAHTEETTTETIRRVLDTHEVYVRGVDNDWLASIIADALAAPKPRHTHDPDRDSGKTDGHRSCLECGAPNV